MPFLKQGSPFIYSDATGDIIGIKDLDGGETYFASFGGPSMPSGGASGQVLAKASATDYDVAWTTPAAASLPPGGSAGQALTKVTSANGDVAWATPPSAVNPLPPGGTAGQALVKNSGTNYDVAWASAAGNAQFQNVSADTTISTNGQRLLVDASGGPRTISLASAAGLTECVVKKLDSSTNAVTIDPFGSQTIDGAASAVLRSQYESITLVSNGSNWSVI